MRRRPSASPAACKAALLDLYDFNVNPEAFTELVICPQDLAPRSPSASSSVKVEMLLQALPRAKNLIRLKILGLDDSLKLSAAAENLHWGDSERQQLGDALRSLGQLTHLGLSGSIGDGKKAADTLAYGLRSLTELQVLDLSHNELGAEGADILAPALYELGKLQHLDLSHAGLYYGGDSQLPYSDNFGLLGLSLPRGATSRCLSSLNLSGNGLGAAGASMLERAITSCKYMTCLDLCGTSLFDDGAIALAPALENLPSLQLLNLRGNKLGWRGASKLAPALKCLLKTLESLDISSNFGQSEEDTEGISILAPAMRTLTALRSLDLSRTGLGSEGADVLAPTLAALEHCSALEQLSLCGNSLGAEAVFSLVIPALSGLTGLRRLSLGDNNLGTCSWPAATGDGQGGHAGALAWATGLKQAGSFKSLQHLDLGDGILTLDFDASGGA